MPQMMIRRHSTYSNCPTKTGFNHRQLFRNRSDSFPFALMAGWSIEHFFYREDYRMGITGRDEMALVPKARRPIEPIFVLDEQSSVPRKPVRAGNT
jgi:hypothetical protein